VGSRGWQAVRDAVPQVLARGAASGGNVSSGIRVKEPTAIVAPAAESSTGVAVGGGRSSGSGGGGSLGARASSRTANTAGVAGERIGEASSSSPSPMAGARARQQPRADFQSQRRFHRQASGLVFNPGTATVDCVQHSKSERRFSVGLDESGQQLLTSLVEQDLRAQQQLMQSPLQRDVGLELCGDEGLVSSILCASSISAASPGAPPTPDVTARGHAPLTAQTPGELFARFLVADSVALAYHAYKALMHRCSGAGGGGGVSLRAELPYRRVQRLCGTALPWRARSVWNLLDARAQRPEYVGAPLSRTRAIICGAGPCGLRAALELALLRANVTVLEKRAAAEAFGRINRVHLWEWCKQDLLGWGAKIFDPPGGTFGGDNDFCHIGIGEMQLLLLKNALLLGAHVRFGTEARDVDDKENVVVCRDGTRMPCDALVIVSGASSPFCRSLGFRSVAVGLRGKGSAIGVVANFKNSRDQREIALRQFSWARQFNLPLFSEVERKTSVNLENVVYYKAQAHHYMVMTPTKKSLLDLGVLRDGRSTNRMLHGSNVDLQQLSAMVQRVGNFFGLPTELCESQGAMIFDFSGVQRLESPATFVGGVFACAAGDALLEPFWPEGLGIIRGFMSALDAASAIVLAAQGRKDQAVAQLTATYNVLKSVAAQTAGQCLQKDPRQYQLQPNTRYILTHGP